MPKLLISILMPAYNAEKTIVAAIYSIIRQKYGSWELVIVNDGSTDRTSAILSEFVQSNSRIKVKTLQTNKGRGFARQMCLELATGQLIAFIDADDLWHPDKLKYQVEAFQNENCSIVATRFAVLEAENNVRYQRKFLSNSGINSFKETNVIPFFHPTVMIEREIAVKIGYQLDQRSLEDDIFLRQYLKEVGLSYFMLDKVLYYYREFDSWNTKKIWDYWWSGFKTIWSQSLSVKKIGTIFIEILKISLKLAISMFFGSDTIVRQRNILMPEAERRYHTGIVKNIVGNEASN